MKHKILLSFFCIMPMFAHELECITTQEGIKKIQCKYEATTRDHARDVAFNWISPDNVADNRTKTLSIKAGHKSVFDFRYFSGRSEGKWIISVTELENNTTTKTQYLKDSNAEVISNRPEDPLLTHPIHH